MSPFNAANSKSPKESAMDDASATVTEDDVKGFDDVVSRHVFQGKPALRNWRIKNAPVANSADAAPSEEKQYSDDSILELPAANARPMGIFSSGWLQVVQAIAVFATVAWATYATIYVLALPGGMAAILSSPLTLGGIVASVLAPIALLWLCLATWQRRADARMYAEALRGELQSLLFPTQEQARVVNADIQTLVQQAVEMSSSSRAAIKAIQRARQGLRAEIRDFAGVSQKTEFHIDRLAETLTKRTADLMSLTEQIEARTSTIEKGTETGIAAWAQAVSEMEGKAATIETLFAKGADTILQASDKATDQIKVIENQLTSTTDEFAGKINELAGKFTNTSDMFEGHAQKLQTVSESVAAEANRLDGAMQTTLQHQKSFEEGAERIASIADKISTSVASGVERIGDTAEALFVRAETVEEKLAQRAESLEQSASRLQTTTASLEGIGDVAANKLSEALSMALSGADSITNSVRRAKEQLEKAAQDTATQAETLSTDTDDKVEALLQATTAKITKISEVLKEFDDRHIEIRDVLTTLDQRGDAVQTSMTSAIGKIESSIQQLHEGAALVESKAQAPLDKIEATIASLADHSADFEVKLGARITDLEGGTQKAKDTVDSIGVALKDHLQDLSLVSGQVSGQARAITDSIQAQKDSLSGLMAQTEEQIEALQTRLKRQEIDLGYALKAAEEQIETLGDKIFDRGELSFSKAQEIASGLRQLEEQIVEDLSRIHERSQLTSEAMKTVAETVASSADATLPRYSEVLDRADQLEQRYSRLNNTFERTSDAVLGGMKQLSGQLEENLDQFDMTSREATQTLMTFVHDVGSSISDIRNVAEEAGDKIADAQNGIKGRTEDLQLMTDQVRIRIDALQRNLNDYTQEIGSMVGRATSQLQDATNLFAESSRTLDERTDIVSSKLQGASRQYLEEGHRLSMLSEQSVHKAARIVAAVQEESERLVDSAQAALQDLQKAGDSLGIRAREVDEYIKASVRNTQSYTNELKVQATVVADTTVESVDRIAGAIGSLTSQAEDAKLIGQKLSQHIEISRQKLADESDRLATVTHKAVQTAEVAASAFTRQSNTLFKAVQDVAIHAEKIRDSQWKTQREAFLSSSKFVIESLYSLSLDVSRHLESELDQRVLKAYQKGDVAAFTRHLVEIAPHIPAERAQRKFVDDSEFRNYVQRFIRQFEELLEQAQTNDYGDMLSAIFSTSDIGRLYKILCEIAGRNSRIH